MDEQKAIKMPLITPDERERMAKKSARSLPNKPGQVGWTPERFKAYITQPLFDDNDSFYYYINRLSKSIEEEVNTLDNTANNKVDTDNGHANNLTIEGGQLNAVNVKTPTMPQHAVNKQYVDDLKGKINQFRTTNSIPNEEEWAYQDYAFVKANEIEEAYKIVENIGNQETRTINVQTSANAIVENEEKVFVTKKDRDKLVIDLNPLDEISLLRIIEQAEEELKGGKK